MNTIKILKSQEDHSVNFVHPNGQESRFVQRTLDYFIAYLSSHNGCNRACRFCHLTQTGQTAMVQASREDFRNQLQPVLNHYKQLVAQGQPAAKRININWMARGEPLSSVFLNGLEWFTTISMLRQQLDANGLEKLPANFNVSTIMPLDLYLWSLPTPSVEDLVDPGTTRIYYSLYSLNPSFRKRWLPKAMNPVHALQKLTKWSNETLGQVILHWAFIKGENDSEKDVQEIVDLVGKLGLKTRFNVVRYNPFSPDQGEESDMETILARFEQLKSVAQIPGSKIVSRVGPDIKASCGMFVEAHT